MFYFEDPTPPIEAEEKELQRSLDKSQSDTQRRNQDLPRPAEVSPEEMLERIRKLM